MPQRGSEGGCGKSSAETLRRAEGQGHEPGEGDLETWLCGARRTAIHLGGKEATSCEAGEARDPLGIPKDAAPSHGLSKS